jgi:hypothetical protein
MKRRKHPSGYPKQLEFEDLIAETVDICIRATSFRREDFVFCPLRIPGWQTTDSLRCYFAPVEFNERWLHEAYGNIKKTETVRDALVMTASYLSDLLDLIIQKDEDEAAGSTNYSKHCDQVIQSIRTNNNEATRIVGFCWEMAQTILESYEACNRLSDWELQEHLESFLPSGPDLEQSLEHKKASLIEVFCGSLCLLHGWIEENKLQKPGVSAE